jgi:WXG100 family type VII secretion target
MATGRIGGNLEQMNKLTQDLSRSSQDVRDLQSHVTSVLTGTDWDGGAADRFRQAWDGQYKTSLTNLQNALTDLSQEVSKRRQALIDVGG